MCVECKFMLPALTGNCLIQSVLYCWVRGADNQENLASRSDLPARRFNDGGVGCEVLEGVLGFESVLNPFV